MTSAFICVICGTQYPPALAPPVACAICADERQFVPPGGQAWTTLPTLARSHASSFRQEGELLGIGSSPAFGIGQRALLVRTPTGNVLWDCVSVIGPATVDILQGLGGLSAIAISHPHFYTTMLAWSRAFGGIPIHLHARDRAWVTDPGPEIAFWDGETHAIAPGLTLIRTGGHFAGGTVMHWAGGAGGRGAVLAGDLLHVGADGKTLGFMRSYPNFIPLGAAAVRKIAAIIEPWPFEAVYGAFWDRVIPAGGKDSVAFSIKRHLDWLEKEAD